MICFSEQQKQEIAHTGMLVIEFKRSFKKTSEYIKRIYVFVNDMLIKLAGGISRSLQVIHREYENLPSRENYKAIRRLDKCGFTEKEINLMIGGTCHCRNNC